MAYAVERRLRNLVVRTPLADWKLVGAGYRAVNCWRYRRRWDVALEFRGARFVVGRDLSLYPFIRTGGFEERELDWLLPRVSRHDMCWDVGANVGIYTVLLSRSVGPRGRVIAFEPTPGTVLRLQHNLALNDVHNVDVITVALGAAAGRGHIELSSDAAGGNHLVDAPTAVSVEVAVETADGVWRAAGHDPAVVKVDIEGREPEFVLGARDMITAARPLLMLEINASIFMGDDTRVRAWDEMLSFLFEVYDGAVFFGPDGVRSVRGLPLSRLPLRPCTLAFEAGRRAA